MLKGLFPAARIYSMYGLTECKRCTYLPPADIDRKPESVGIPIPNTELWIVDEGGKRVGVNVVGQLVIRGATVMKGYWEKPEATAKKLKPGPLPGEQVLYTGDYCRLDDEGYLYFVGRMDDIIKSRGEKVAPKEVEAVLYNIPGVREAAVIGVDDQILGQAVKAVRGARVRCHPHRKGRAAPLSGKAREFHGPEVRQLRDRAAQNGYRQDQNAGTLLSESFDVAAATQRGRVTFMGIELFVAHNALVPRAETELLAATAIETLKQSGIASPQVIDMCCGVGNLACAIAYHAATARIRAGDLTEACVELARRNVVSHGLEERVSVHQGDLFAPFAESRLHGAVDLIVCNPPYISEGRLQGDRAHLLEMEPREAFAAGPYGLSIHMRVVKDAVAFLRPGGTLMFEVGAGQARQVEILFGRTRSFDEVRSVLNDKGEGRVVLGRRKA